jgi:hypothetical protein
MTINTTAGPQPREAFDRPNPHHVVNTSRVMEEDLHYEDEDPEIIAVLPADPWCALIGDELVSLVAFVALEDGTIHGVAVGDDGRIDLKGGNVEDLDGFAGYEQSRH